MQTFLLYYIFTTTKSYSSFCYIYLFVGFVGQSKNFYFNTMDEISIDCVSNTAYDKFLFRNMGRKLDSFIFNGNAQLKNSLACYCY